MCTSDRNCAVKITAELDLAKKAAMVKERFHEQEKQDKAKDLETGKLNNQERYIMQTRIACRYAVHRIFTGARQ